MTKLAAGAVALLIVLAACGSDENGTGADPAPAPTPTGSAPPTTTEPAPTTWPSDPPPIVFATPDGPIEEAPFTVCWSAPPPDDPNAVSEAGYCADGMPENPPTVEPIDGAVRFSFEVVGWEFRASWLTSGGSLDVEPIDATSWSLIVPEVVTDIVMVSGFGPQGDVHAAIRLPSDRTPVSEARFPVEVVDRCADGVSVVVEGSLYLLFEELDTVPPDAGYPWEESDFPDHWNVEILNAAPVDGDNFVIFDAEARPINDTTVEVRDAASGDPIGTFVLDETPVDQRVFCG